MKSVGMVVLSLLVVVSLVLPAEAAPIVPGLSGNHPLKDAQVGQLLMTELRCGACHRTEEASAAPDRLAPNLTEVGSRVTADYLRRFIESPAMAHPGSTMPDLLAGEPVEARGKITEALTHFLMAQTPRKGAEQPTERQDVAAGKRLFHSVGCVACHSPRDDRGGEVRTEGVVKLGHLPEKYRAGSLGEFLFQPLRVRPSGRMPDMKLTRQEARDIAAYLLGSQERKPETFQPQPDLVARGKEHFQRLNCAACHQLGDVPPAKPIARLTEANPRGGCLAEKPGKAPWFHLNETQRQAIRAALTSKPGTPSEKERLAHTLTAFNCIACHARDDYGGVPESLNEHFQASEKELGDEGRIPPPLTLIGAKLTRVTLQKVLYDGDGVRSYMTTRMPQFGESNLRHLPDLFARLDSVKKVEFNLPPAEGRTQKERDREREMRAAGRELVGDKGLSCVACHTFKGKAASKPGIDLLTFAERLQPSWFYHFVRDPGAFRPRTVMPTAWPGGKAVHDTILNGDTDRQIEAIWYYLSLGTSAQDPSGVQPAETLLSATDAARTYRGRSTVAGYRGIAVGFPERMNYAFNAETGTLSALWSGDFIRVNRSGQGSGSFNPAAKAVTLAQDVSFHRLPDEMAAWPLRPVMTKENPVNPDPLYPKNHGYQFRGYQLDDRSIPTFEYRSGNVEIEDHSTVEKVGSKVRLVRTLTFNAPENQTVWFRALTGMVEADGDQKYKTPELRVSVPAGTGILRPSAADAKTSELLLKFTLPAGKSTQTLRYELLP